MNMVKLLLAAIITSVTLFLSAGCVSESKMMTVEPLCDKTAGITEAMEASEKVLGQMHFVIEKSDRGAGLIRTRPLEGSQFFEFWRKDNIGSFNRVYSNLHSARRIVELKFIANDGGGICILPSVSLQHLSIPEEESGGTAKAYTIISDSSEEEQSLSLNPEQASGMGWVDLGSDAALEAKILKQISKQIKAFKQREK